MPEAVDIPIRPVAGKGLFYMTGITRLELQNMLEDILGSDRVYYQPPATLRMKYPCIRLENQAMSLQHANNAPYVMHDRYRIIFMSTDPESPIPKKIAALPGVRAAQPYDADNLHHWPFEIWNVRA